MIIAIHTNPDMDCITGAWLLQRYGNLATAAIAFVNTGNPDRELLANATAVIDTGGEWDPARLRFDHHHLPGAAASETSAAMQVYEHLVAHSSVGSLDHLAPLANLVYAGDTGKPDYGADWSRIVGLHAMLSGYKAWLKAQHDGGLVPGFDQAVYAYGAGLLDVLDAALKAKHLARQELAEKVVYRSTDGLLVAIRHGGPGSTQAAADDGARLVVWEGQPAEVEGGTTYSIGLSRVGESQEPHCGELVQSALDTLAGDDPIYQELATWFRHPAGFIALRGSAKAPVFKPVEVDLVDVARVISAAWQR